MDNQGMLRNTGLRAQREYIDTGTGTMRTAGDSGREAHVGRGTFVNWYEDLGISTTQPAAEGMRKEEQEYKAKVAEQESRIAEARSKYNEAQGRLGAAQGELSGKYGEVSGIQLPELQSAVDNSWNQYKSSLTPVRVIGRGDAIEATYYLPRETADQLIAKRGIFASYVDGGQYLNVMAKDYRNQELHDPLREGAISLETQYRAKAQEQIARELGVAQGDINNAYGQLDSAQGQLNEAAGQIGAYGAEIASAEGMLSGVKQKHQDQWNEIHGKYQQRSEKMKSILENIMVGGGQPDA